MERFSNLPSHSIVIPSEFDVLAAKSQLTEQFVIIVALQEVLNSNIGETRAILTEIAQGFLY
jgi:hypothetical protein